MKLNLIFFDTRVSFEKERQMKKRPLMLAVILILVGFSLSISPKTFSESDKVLARVGDKVITQSDLAEFMKKYEALKRGESFGLDEKKNFLNMLIQNAFIAIEAEREKLDQKPEIQLKLKMLKSELLANEYITTRIAPSIVVKDEEVDEILKKNPNLIPREMLTLKEILVKTEKEADKIYQELKKGADFSKMAMEKSIAQSKMQGGLIGTISKGQLPPPLEAAVFDLKEGKFSQPIETADGFWIFYLVSRKERDPEEMKRLEGRLREKIIQLERNKKIGAMIEKKVEELKKEIKVETYLDQLK